MTTPTHVQRSAVPLSTHDTTRIDDLRIKAVRPLITPALLQEWLPAPEAAQQLVETSRAAISDVLAGPGRPAHRRRRSLLHPRPRPGHGLCAPAQGPGRRPGRRAARGHARLLREAPHHRGLEGLHQRPAPGRQLRHQRRPGNGPRPAAGRAGPGPARGHGIPGPAVAAIHQRPGQLGRHRRAHHGKPEPPPAGQRPVLPRGLQERHGRRRQGGQRCHPGGQRAPRLHGHDQDGPVPPSSRPAAMATATSSCVAASSPTTAPSMCRPPAPYWKAQACARRS